MTCYFNSDPVTHDYRREGPKRGNSVTQPSITEQRLFDERQVINSTELLSNQQLNELKEQLEIGGQSQKDKGDLTHMQGTFTTANPTNHDLCQTP